MPKRRISCKVIKVSKSGEGTRTETLIENLFDSGDSSSDEARGADSRSESGNSDSVSLPTLTLQIIKKLFPKHCRCGNCASKDDICRQCKESLDYNSSSLPCWYQSSNITGWIFKQAIVRLEAEYASNEQYKHKFLAKFLYMLERYDKDINPNVLFNRPTASASLMKSLFNNLKRKDQGCLSIFQTIDNQVLAKVLKVDDFSPLKAMSLELCHLIHLYTWKTVSIRNGVSVSQALIDKSEKTQQVTQREGKIREDTAKQIFDHFNTVKGMIFNYFLLNYQDYCDIVVWNQFTESLISMLPTMFEFKSNKKDAWLECVIFHISKLFWYNWMRGPDTWNIVFSTLKRQEKEEHYLFKYPVDKTSTSDTSFKYVEFHEPVAPKILCPKHEISCKSCNTKIQRGSYLYQWSMGTGLRHNGIIGKLFPREIQYLERNEKDFDDIPDDLTRYKRDYQAVCSRKCYIECEKSKFPQLHIFLKTMRQVLPELKQTNCEMIKNNSIAEGDNTSKINKRSKEKLKMSIDIIVDKLLTQHRKIELDGLRDLVLLEYLAIKEEDLEDLTEFSRPSLSWKRFFIPLCFHLTVEINSQIILACKRVSHFLTEDALSKLDYDHLANVFTKELPTRLSVQMCEGTNIPTLLSNFKRKHFIDRICKNTKDAQSQKECKHQTLKTIKLVWKKEWASLYSSSYVPFGQDFCTEMSFETCERLEGLEMFSSDKQVLWHRQRCMKEVMAVFDMPHCCVFPINNNLVEIKDLKQGHPFMVSDNRQKQHIKTLIKHHDYLVFATNLDLKLQKCAGGILFFDEDEKTHLCGVILTGWNMYRFLMDDQKIRPFLNSYAIYERWNFDKSYLKEHESLLVAEKKELNPFTAGRPLHKENMARNRGIGRHKFGALTLCLFKDTLEQLEKIHKPCEIIEDEYNLYGIPVCIKVYGLLNTEKESDKPTPDAPFKGKHCFMETLFEGFGHHPLRNVIHIHNATWTHHPNCFLARPWICGFADDKIPVGKTIDIHQIVDASNETRGVNCHKCGYDMHFVWDQGQRCIDQDLPIHKLPMLEGSEKEFGISKTETLCAKVIAGFNPFVGYMIYNDPYKVIFPGNYELFMLEIHIDPDLITSDCMHKKPPRNGIKIMVDGGIPLSDALHWALTKFRSSLKHQENHKILLLDVNDESNKTFIHVSLNNSAWELNEAVGISFGHPLTLFIKRHKNPKKKENAIMTCTTDVVNFPYRPCIDRQFFNDHHITAIPHYLNWHCHAFALVPEGKRNRHFAPQTNLPVFDYQEKSLRKKFSFCYPFDIFVSRCSLEKYEAKKCCQAVAEVEFFKCKFVLLIKLNQFSKGDLAELVSKQVRNESKRGYCVTVGPSIDSRSNKDLSKEFLINDSSQGSEAEDCVMIMIGSQGSKSTSSQGIHYGILLYNVDSRQMQLFIPSNINWHSNYFEEIFNVSEIVTKLNKHFTAKQEDMYGILFYPPELRSDEFVNFKICHVARFRNEMKPKQQGILVFLSMQTVESQLKSHAPNLFNYLNGYELFCIWPHLNQNNIKRKFKRLHEFGSMLITHDDYMCDLIKMDNHIEAGADYQDAEVVIFTSYSLYDAYSNADSSSHVILTAKMGSNGMFHFKMLTPEHKSEAISVLRNISKTILSKTKSLGCRGQYTVESMFKKMRSNEKVIYNNANPKTGFERRGSVSEEKSLPANLDIEDTKNKKSRTEIISENQTEHLLRLMGFTQIAIEDCHQNKDDDILEERMETSELGQVDGDGEKIVASPKSNAVKQPLCDQNPSKQNDDRQGKPISAITDTKISNEKARVTKQKEALSKLLKMIEINPEHASVNNLSKSLNRRCDSCQEEFPKDKHGVVICMKCRKTIYCNAVCRDAGYPKHFARCGRVQEENNRCLITDLDI